VLGVGIAKTAELLDFHTVGVFLLVLRGVVVTLLARYASQGDFGTHGNPSLIENTLDKAKAELKKARPRFAMRTVSY